MALPYNPAAEPEARWILALIGIIAIVFGIAAVVWPGITLFVLIMLFGVQALLTGIVEIVAMFKAISEHRTWWTHLLLAIIFIAAGLYVFLSPSVTTLILLYVIAFWAIAFGVIEIIGAFTTGRFLSFITGLLGILVGFVLLSNPMAGALAYVIVIGVFAIIRGIVLLVEAIRGPTISTAS